jgi:hypothetical protein
MEAQHGCKIVYLAVHRRIEPMLALVLLAVVAVVGKSNRGKLEHSALTYL